MGVWVGVLRFPIRLSGAPVDDPPLLEPSRLLLPGGLAVGTVWPGKLAWVGLEEKARARTTNINIRAILFLCLVIFSIPCSPFSG